VLRIGFRHRNSSPSFTPFTQRESEPMDFINVRIEHAFEGSQTCKGIEGGMLTYMMSMMS
jgi:hypothetical protein